MLAIMSAETVWFYECKGERLGPVAAREILDLHRQGTVGSDTLVWREGFPDWTPFSATELAVQASSRSAPPPMPPVLSPAPPPVPRHLAPFVPREARLRPDFKPSIRQCYGRAWEALKARFWPLIGCYVLTSLMLGVAGQLYAPILFLMYPLMGGLYWYILMHLRGKEPNLEMLFEGFRRQFGPLAILNLIVVGISLLLLLILAAAIAGVGVGLSGSGLVEQAEENPAVLVSLIGGGLLLFFLLAMPLMILGIVGNFACLLILDCETPVKRALSLGWEATKPHLLKFVLFMFVNGLLSFAGVLALYFGVFITGAWATIALVCVYEDAFGEKASAGVES